jgi:HPt (histidine-containing phosphotransfer) domain-containing protein
MTRLPSINPKQLLVVMVPALASLVVACGTIILLERSRNRQEVASELALLSDVVSRSCAAPLLCGDEIAASKVLSSLEAHPRILHACLFDPLGRRIAHHVRRGAPDLCPHLPPETDGDAMEAGTLLTTRTIALDGRRIATLSLCSDLTSLEERTRKSLAPALVAFAISLAVALILGRILGRVLTGSPGKLVGRAPSVISHGTRPLRAGGEDEPASIARIGCNPRDADSPSTPDLDLDVVRDLTEGDESVLRGALGIFLEECPRLLHRIEEKLASDQREDLERAAHSLKGLAGSVAAERTRRCALRLETTARSATPASLSEAVAGLRRCIEAASEAARAYLGSDASGSLA